MKTNPQQLAKASIDKVQSSVQTLEKISSTCCLPMRSKKMQDTFQGLDNINQLLQDVSKDSLLSVIEEIEQCGSQIGKLYVSCCTEQKEPLYHQLFKQLNEVNTNVYKMLGIGH